MRSIRVVTADGVEGIIEERADGSFVVYRSIARVDLGRLMEAMEGVRPEIRQGIMEWIERGAGARRPN